MNNIFYVTNDREHVLDKDRFKGVYPSFFIAFLFLMVYDVFIL